MWPSTFFYDKNVKYMQHKIVHNLVEFPRHVKSGCRQLIRLLLTKNPKHRISVEEIYDTEWYQTWKDFTTKYPCDPNETLDQS